MGGRGMSEKAPIEEIILRYANGKSEAEIVHRGIDAYVVNEYPKDIKIDWPLKWPMPMAPLTHRRFRDSGTTQGGVRVFVEEVIE
jgi:hypothetical protein